MIIVTVHSNWLYANRGYDTARTCCLSPTTYSNAPPVHLGDNYSVVKSRKELNQCLGQRSIKVPSRLLLSFCLAGNRGDHIGTFETECC
jgi:hypothetical protein